MNTDQDTARERNAAFLRRCWQDGQYYTERDSMFFSRFDGYNSLLGPQVLVPSGAFCHPMRFTGSSLLVSHTARFNGQHSYAWIHT